MLFERTEDWDERVAVGELGSSRNAVVEQQQHEQLERLELLPKLLVSKILKKGKILSRVSNSISIIVSSIIDYFNKNVRLFRSFLKSAR